LFEQTLLIMRILKSSIVILLLGEFSLTIDGFLLPKKRIAFHTTTSNSCSNIIHMITNNNNFGKGDDTIKELNRFTSIVIDPELVDDPSFWDYCLIPNEQAPMRLRVLCSRSNNGDGAEKLASDALVACGVDLEDISFYEENYGVFEIKSHTERTAPTSMAGLVVAKKTLENLLSGVHSDETSIEIDIDTFAMVIQVLNTDVEVDFSSNTNIENGSGSGGCSEYGKADIEVSSLGELRALTICSYAYLTKRC